MSHDFKVGDEVETIPDKFTRARHAIITEIEGNKILGYWFDRDVPLRPTTNLALGWYDASSLQFKKQAETNPDGPVWKAETRRAQIEIMQGQLIERDERITTLLNENTRLRGDLAEALEEIRELKALNNETDFA